MYEYIHKHACRVSIEGLPPGILLHNPSGMGSNDKSAKKVILTAEDEALSACYFTDDKKSLALPSMNMRSGIVQAASGWKLPSNKKLALPSIVAGDMSVEPYMIPFGTLDYVIDRRRAVIQRQGIIRSRPLIFPWKLDFIVRWEAQHLGVDFHETILPELLARLGGTIGLGDFRPAKKGPFGRFVVLSIEEE